ncbi:hypothetical protein [Thiocystis violacea]|uniref:hypothetical protein n=1 Tax=Thiocystis violacea TaxID=13725 RepID=UPI001907632C|nr:hypothetical protein [Thiocystis violacea]MBK1724087.1 hypothetical protein [Thiocystis violacea]
MKRSQPLLGSMAGLAHSAQEHLHELVACPSLGLEQKAKEQCMTFTGLGQVAQIADLHSRGLGRELPDLGVCDALKEGLEIDNRVQLRQALGPMADVL